MSEEAEIRRGGNAWWIAGAVVLVLLVLPFLGFFLWGLFLPDDYEVSASGVLAASPEAVYEALSDPEQQRSWRPGVARAEVGPGERDDPVVVLHTNNTELTLQRTTAVPSSEVVWTVMPSRKAVFQGSWTYELAPVGVGTRLTVIERGSLTSPFARAATRAFFGLDTYSRANVVSVGRYLQVETTLDE